MIQLQTVPAPRTFPDVAPVLLTDATLLERKNRVLTRINEAGLDALVIYADKEHGSNFEYLTRLSSNTARFSRCPTSRWRMKPRWRRCLATRA